METKIKKDVYQMITDRIIEQLEKGIVPWLHGWSDAIIPTNLITLKPFRGVNILLLSSLGYEENYFLTFKQLKELGGKVKQDEKSYPIVYWEWIENDAEIDSGKKKSLLRYYSVYNVSQCDGIPQDKIPLSTKPVNSIQSCEELLFRMTNQPQIVQVADMPCYVLSTDVINMPSFKSFESEEIYYETLFKKLIHSTGHEKRLNRKELMTYDRKNKEDFSLEALIGKIGTSFLKAHTGISGSQFKNDAKYISGWIEQFRKDKSLIVYASTQAQKAVDFIINSGNGKESSQ